MDFSLSFILNGVLGLAMFFMKIAHDQTKETLSLLRQDVDNVKDTYFKKEDFKDFKEELWKRLDRMEDNFSRKEPK